jgi:outer membrane biosynthesis protein TonB
MGKVYWLRGIKIIRDSLFDSAAIVQFKKWRFKPKKVRRVKIPIMLATDKK